MPEHSGYLAGARTLENMKTTPRRRTHHRSAATPRQVIGHGTPGVREPGQEPLAGTRDREAATVGPGTYEVRCDFVMTHQSADPAQIPWLEELRGNQHLSDLHSEVI